MMLNNIGLPGLVLLLIVLIFLFYVPYRISIRMGFSAGGALLIALSSLFALPLILWWALDWPIEYKSGRRSGGVE